MGKHEILPKRLEFLEVGNVACQFRINVDVLNEAFGLGRSMYAKACYPDRKDAWILGQKSGDKFRIWMPKLYKNSSEWVNSISEDGKTIYETAEPTKSNDWIDDDDSDFKRIVFVKNSPKSPYRFAGVFENEELDFMRHSYRRIATKVALIGSPAMSIKLLDEVHYSEKE